MMKFIVAFLFCTLSTYAQDYQLGKINLMQVESTEILEAKKKRINNQYYLYLPKDYTEDDDNKKPLVIMIHGLGILGDDINMINMIPVVREAMQSDTLDYMLLAPQMFGKSNKISPKLPKQIKNTSPQIKALVDEVVKKYNVDKYRIYVTGLSLGGFTTWQLVQDYPDFFAAAVPVCGGDFNKGENIDSLTTTPIWTFHSRDDATVPFSLKYQKDKNINVGSTYVWGFGRVCITTADIVYMLNEKQATNVHQFTIFTDKGHNSWDSAYSNQDMWEWMMKQKLVD